MNGWEIFAVICAIAAPLSVALIALIGRLNDLDEDQDTIIIPPAMEPDGTVHHGEMVDIKELMRRYG